MLCPWQFVFKPRAAKNQSSEEKDINNNVEKNGKIHGLENDDAELYDLSKKRIEMPPIKTSAKASDGREVCF